MSDGLGAGLGAASGWWKNRAVILIGTLLPLVCTAQAARQAAAPPSLTGVAPPANEAGALMQAGRYREAEALLRQQLTADPGSRQAHAALAYCLLRANEPAKALEEYTRASAIAPPDSAELTAVGQAYVLLGDLTDADHWTLRATRTNAADPEAWYSLGRIRYTEQRFGDAAVCYEHVLALRPRAVKAENNLGLAFEGMNRPDAAIRAYRQAIAWQEAGRPEEASEQPLLNLGTLLLHRGQLAEAQPLLKQAALLAPKDAHVHEQQGQLSMQQSDYNAAASEFGQASQLDPGNSALHFLLGQAFRHLGRQAEAQAQLALAAKLAGTAAGSRPK